MGLDEKTLGTCLIRHETGKTIDRILKTTFTRALPEGENYTSVIWRVTCEVILKSGRREVRRLIVKEAITAGHFGQMLSEHGLFKREIQAYENVLKKMQDLMEDHSDHREIQWAELIGVQNNSLIILQDLTAKGYKTINRKEMLDLSHTLLLIEELGRFHVMGLALLQKGAVDKNLFDPWLYSREDFFRILIVRALKAFGEAVKSAWGIEWKKTVERVEKSTEVAYETFFKMVQVDPNRFNVINHGDCWSNNVMFKWNDERKPVGLRFLDFQLMHYNSFGFDLTYMLYNSTQPEVRRNHSDDILTAYMRSLERNMVVYGVDVKVPTLDEIKKEMRRLRFLGYLLLCSIHPVTTAEVKPLDLESASDKTSESMGSINQEIFKAEKFRRHVAQDLISFVDEGVI